jgi:hypothetical protein
VNVSATLNLPTGVYDVCVEGTDAAGNSSDPFDGTEETADDCTLLAVYDPSAGFVTGGGWIWSPAGASTDFPTAEGKASFGFVSKYKKGAKVPDGETQFQFKAGDINFHSTAYEWLVVGGWRAQYKGTGRLNGVDGYGFILTAIDGKINGSGGSDRFRIKIHAPNGGIVYDNQMNLPDTSDPSTTLGGGSIVIHTGKK